MALIVLCHISTPESRFRTGSKYHQTARADKTLPLIHVRSARETKILPHFKNFFMKQKKREGQKGHLEERKTGKTTIDAMYLLN